MLVQTRKKRVKEKQKENQSEVERGKDATVIENERHSLVEKKGDVRESVSETGHQREVERTKNTNERHPDDPVAENEGEAKEDVSERGDQREVEKLTDEN